MMGANASDSLLALHNGCQTNHVIRYIGMVANNGKEIRGEAYRKYTKSSQYMHSCSSQNYARPGTKRNFTLTTNRSVLQEKGLGIPYTFREYGWKYLFNNRF